MYNTWSGGPTIVLVDQANRAGNVKLVGCAAIVLDAAFHAKRVRGCEAPPRFFMKTDFPEPGGPIRSVKRPYIEICRKCVSVHESLK